MALLGGTASARREWLDRLAQATGADAILVAADDPSLDPLDLDGNVGFPLRARGIAATERARLVGEILALTGLERRADRSDGDARSTHARMVLARGIATGRRVLLLDDLADGLCGEARHALMRRIRGVAPACGVAIVLATSEREDALAMADRIAVLERDRIVQFDRAGILFERPAAASVASLLGDANLLTARIEPDDEDASSARVRLPGGETMPVTLAEAADGHPDRLCRVAIRPDQIAFAAIEAAQMGGDAIAATLVEHRHLGREVRLRFRLGDGSVLRVVRPSGAVSPVQLARAAEPGGASLAWRETHAVAFAFDEG